MSSMAGRSSKLTPEVERVIIDNILLGLPYHLAAEAAGIHRSTYFRWMDEGSKAETGKQKAFYDKVKKAEGVCARNLSTSVMKAAKQGDWKAAMTMLERRWPADYGRRDRVDSKVEHSGAEVVFEVRKASEHKDEKDENE